MLLGILRQPVVPVAVGGPAAAGDALVAAGDAKVPALRPLPAVAAARCPPSDRWKGKERNRLGVYDEEGK